MELPAGQRLGRRRWRKTRQVRQRWFDRQSGPEAAAFTAAALVLLQDAPLDAANYYSADIQGFGMFTEHGAPKKAFYALKAFKMLADTPLRLAVNGPMPAGVAVGAGIDKSRRQMTILASNFGAHEERIRFRIAGLPWQGPTVYQVRLLDAQHDLTPALSRPVTGDATVVEQAVRPASVYVITLQAGENVALIEPRRAKRLRRSVGCGRVEPARRMWAGGVR